MSHRTSVAFWREYTALPAPIRSRADKQFALLKTNPQHPSLQFKRLFERNAQEVWSARVSLNYRALAIRRPDGYFWFWIGDHKTYDFLVS
jgi:hypothetical protein